MTDVKKQKENLNNQVVCFENDEKQRQELIAQITTEIKTIKRVKFLQFYLDMTRAFKRKWGI